MRRSLLNQLLKWKDKKGRKPLLLKGARQVGKTTLLHQFGKEHFPFYHSINFEKEPKLCRIFDNSLDPKHILKELEYHFNRPIDVAKDLLIFDEIQTCPKALTSLKYFAEDCPELAVTAAGSLLGVYLGPVSFPVGKVDIITLYPMSFQEFLLALGETRLLDSITGLQLADQLPSVAHDRLFESLIHYFIVGGLPEAVITFRNDKEHMVSAFANVREKQQTLISTYLADIAKHSGKANAMHVARILEAIPNQLAKTQDGSGSKFKFTGVVPGIDRYNRLASGIDWLEAAGLIIKVPIVNSGQIPFSAYASENTFKLYLFDVGLLGAMSNLSPTEIIKYDYGSYKGFFAENYVAQAFLTSQTSPLYSWQEKLAEVEFLYQGEGKAIPIEVKSGWVTHAKSAKIFAEKYHSPYRVIFSAHPLSVSPSVHRYPLYLAGQFPLPSN